MARYRDRETGHFASFEKWESDHGPGGRYVREVSPGEKEITPPPLTEEEIDYGESEGFDYDLGEDEY